MFTLTHDGDDIGFSRLERGDPSSHTVSGVFNNMGGAKALAGWIKSIGGEEDEGVVFVTLNKGFTLLDQTGKVIEFQDGNLISIPEDDEVFLDITGISEEVYKTYFAEHISAMEN
ncbi:MAG: hypothetical protein OQK98_02750 [Gammaproteobacteria bacterium]|nr:hypothetical protein [Gammaproteobacteria bacterium]